MGTFIKATKVGQIDDNAGLLVQAQDKEIAVIRRGDDYFALDNECTHVGGPLCEGLISGSEVVCPWHGARFDLRTGEVLAGPARRGVGTYRVRVSGEDLEIEV
jgi:nitrite reductase/ring-hydroxylating ferredoxin subunit